MRKRTLYLSELVRKNTNKKIDFCVIENEKVTYYSKDYLLTIDEVLNKQVTNWYYNEYYGIVIQVK